MRSLLVAVLCFIFVGVVWGYARISVWLAPPSPTFQYELAEGNYSVSICSNFDVPKGNQANLVVRLNGKEILASQNSIESGIDTRLDNLSIRQGENLLFVSVKAPDQSLDKKLIGAASFLLDGDDEGTAPTSNDGVDSKASKVIDFQFVRVQIFRDGAAVRNGDTTTHLDSQNEAIVELVFTAFGIADNAHAH